MPYFKGGDRGGDRGGRPNFRKQGSHAGPRTMHDAICGNCGNPCQVPFRPSGEKPVYCRDCFPKMTGSTSNRFGNDDHRVSQPIAPRPFVPAPISAGNDEVKKQLEGVNARLERLIAVVQGLALTQTVPSPVSKPIKKTSKK